jgi:hypothetical protein
LTITDASAIGDTDWALRGTCRVIIDKGLMERRQVYKLFFPTRQSNSAASRSAKVMCNEFCPVRDECLADGIAKGDRFGIRGGTTADDRRKMREGNVLAMGSGGVDAYLGIND